MNIYNEITIGMGATISIGSDREPATVIDISDNLRTITLQADSYVRTDSNGFSESQEYEYSPNPIGEIYKATLRKDGQYRLVGSNKSTLSLGVRRRYYNFSF